MAQAQSSEIMASQTGDSMPSRDIRTPVDLRSLDFLSSIDDNLFCSVCHCAFILPVMTKCGHIFCKECYESATRDQKGTCPFCRSPIHQADIQAAPRALVNMVDDLKVKCPNTPEGCVCVTTRGTVQNHVDKYCDFLQVPCEGEDCSQRMLKKDLGRGCQHQEVECRDCQELVVGKDLDHHRRSSCRDRFARCPHCSSTHLVCDTTSHESQCPEMIVSCLGSSTGCPTELPRGHLSAHISSCPFARLSPLISSQSTRLQALEHENTILRRKLDAFSSPTLSPMPSNNLPPFPDSGDSTASSTNHHPSENHPLHLTTNESHSIELQTHLITSYESLRSDIDRLTASMSDLDARQSVLVMNESLRVKDDLAHLNAVIGSMRVQLHWLMSNRLQTQQRQQHQQQVGRPSPASAAAVTAGPSTGAGSSSGANGGGRGASVGRADEGSNAPRRLSETSRQETKL